MSAGASTSLSVRDATFEVLRRHGLTTIFSNPGSTEVPFLVGLPADLRFVLALHEGSAVGMATGHAIGRDAPALVLLHTTAGLGNAVGALATARVNRAPLVVIVGQQDRRHLALEPFLAGRLLGLAGDYPVWTQQPARPQEVPAAIARAFHEAIGGRGPALVIVPMDDWQAPAGPGWGAGAPQRVLRPPASGRDAAAQLAAMIIPARAPALVVGAGADDAATWSALVALAERLVCPVFQEPFGARAGFPQDHPAFAGHLPARRRDLRDRLADHDLVLVVGAGVLRQYGFDDGPLFVDGTRVAQITDDSDEAHRSPAALSVVGSPSVICTALAELIPARADRRSDRDRFRTPRSPSPGRSPTGSGAGERPAPADVFDALAAWLPAGATVVEETPSSRRQLQDRVPARAPLGFLSAAMGGLGFALPAAVGLRLACPTRPVVAVLGDGSALYQVQGLWSAARYHVGVLFIVLANGRYAIMDHLAELQDADAPWPDFEEVDVAGAARSLGCAAMTVDTPAALEQALAQLLPGLGERDEPLVLEVRTDDRRSSRR